MELRFYILGDPHLHYFGGIGNGAIVVLRTGFDFVDKFHSGYYASPNRVLSVEEWRWCKANEKLAVTTVGVRGARHGDGAPDMLFTRKFSLKLLAGTAGTVSEWVSCLGHKSRYDTVEGETVIKTFAGQLFDASHMARGNTGKHLDDYSA